MEDGSCQWYLFKDEDSFAIQYTGPDPDEFLPIDLNGIVIFQD